MPRVCTICTHSNRADIDAAIIEGVPNRRIAARFGALSETSVRRHAEGHLPATLTKASGVAETVQAGDLLTRLRALNQETADVLREARRVSDQDLRLRAIARVEKQIELEGRLIGELERAPTVNISLSPEWLAARTVLLVALSPYPDARMAAGAALAELEGSVRPDGR